MFSPFRLTITALLASPSTASEEFNQVSTTVISNPMQKSMFWLLNAVRPGTLRPLPTTRRSMDASK
jgi:hypothetical protein